MAGGADVVTPADIEAKAREVEAALEETKASMQDTAVLAGAAIAAAVVLAYLVGRRRGRRSIGKTFVEVYQVK